MREHSDYGDTWFELGLGGNVRISKTGNFYGEVTRGFGGDINKKWSVNCRAKVHVLSEDLRHCYMAVLI